MIARSLRKERERERGLERASKRREGERVREIVGKPICGHQPLRSGLLCGHEPHVHGHVVHLGHDFVLIKIVIFIHPQ